MERAIKPVLNHHKIYKKVGNIINPYAWAGLPMNPLIEPIGFSASAQAVNIYKIFNDFVNTNKAYGYSVDDTFNTLTLPSVAGVSYRYGYTSVGIDYVFDVASVTTPFVAGYTKRFVIYNSTASNITALIPKGAMWVYIGSRCISLNNTASNNTLKYVHYQSLNNLLFIGAPFLNAVNATGQLYIPTNNTVIVTSCFESCTNLTGSINIHSGVTTLGLYSFYNLNKCTGALNLPSTITSIGTGCFDLCSNLTQLNLASGYNPTQANDNWKFNFSTKFTATSLNQSIINIPNTTRTITIGATNKARLLASFPSAETNANARGITIV